MGTHASNPSQLEQVIIKAPLEAEFQACLDCRRRPASVCARKARQCFAAAGSLKIANVSP
jgi:hypothetical protein